MQQSSVFFFFFWSDCFVQQKHGPNLRFSNPLHSSVLSTWLQGYLIFLFCWIFLLKDFTFIDESDLGIRMETFQLQDFSSTLIWLANINWRFCPIEASSLSCCHLSLSVWVWLPLETVVVDELPTFFVIGSILSTCGARVQNWHSTPTPAFWAVGTLCCFGSR